MVGEMRLVPVGGSQINSRLVRGGGTLVVAQFIKEELAEGSVSRSVLWIYCDRFAVRFGGFMRDEAGRRPGKLFVTSFKEARALGVLPQTAETRTRARSQSVKEGWWRVWWRFVLYARLQHISNAICIDIGRAYKTSRFS